MITVGLDGLDSAAHRRFRETRSRETSVINALSQSSASPPFDFLNAVNASYAALPDVSGAAITIENVRAMTGNNWNVIQNLYRIVHPGDGNCGK